MSRPGPMIFWEFLRLFFKREDLDVDFGLLEASLNFLMSLYWPDLYVIFFDRIFLYTSGW